MFSTKPSATATANKECNYGPGDYHAYFNDFTTPLFDFVTDRILNTDTHVL